MSAYIVDVEADGPCAGLYSMVQVGAVKVTRELDTFFDRSLKPMTEMWIDDALKSCNMTREQTLTFEDPRQVIVDFREWVLNTSVDQPTLISDNPAFDWQFVNYYFTYFLGAGQNPFGFSARRIGDFYAGVTSNWRNGNKWKKFRKTAHTHKAKDDAMGNAEALIYVLDHHNIESNWK